MGLARTWGRLRRQVAWLLPLAFGVSGCGGSRTSDADGDVGVDVADRDEGGSEDGGSFDSPGDAGDASDLDGTDPEADALDAEEPEYVIVPPASGICGDGVLDPGEECDDRNRLNGDGCDWLCQLGDGDPPPEPDPGAGDFVPDGEPGTLAGTAADHFVFERLPLVWTGSEFATAWFESYPEESAGRIRFWRFDRTGRRIDAEWAMPSLRSEGGMEVVWTGTGFGLFYVERETGLWYLRLDRDGKPMSEPVLIEADPRARQPAADLTADGAFVLAWRHEASDMPIASACNSIDVPDEIRIRRVEIEGATPGAVHRLLAASGGPDVATGDSGFGVVYLEPKDGDHLFCAIRFVKLDASLGDPRYVGILGEGMTGDVRWIPERSTWLTAWSYSPGGADSELRVASIDASGALAAAPIRNRLVDHHWVNTPVRVAPTPDALAFVYSWDSDTQFEYLPADRTGVATSLPRSICLGPSPFCIVTAYGATGTADGFAVLFAKVGDAGPPGLVLQLFRSVP